MKYDNIKYHLINTINEVTKEMRPFQVLCKLQKLI